MADYQWSFNDRYVVQNCYFQAPSGNTAIKKILNIPICDVTVDTDYNKDVVANYHLPPVYLKHNKKIGDDVDVSLEYILDKEDEVSVLENILTIHCILYLFYVQQSAFLLWHVVSELKHSLYSLLRDFYLFYCISQ